MKKKSFIKTFAALLCVCIIANTICFSAFAVEQTAVSIENANVTAGTTVTVSMNISDNSGICALIVRLKYDASVFTLKEVTDGGLFSGFASGKNLVFDDERSIYENGTLVTFTFAVSANAQPGNYSIAPVICDCSDENGNAVPMSVLPSTVRIKAADGKKGDLNGDGKINVSDGILIKKFIVGKIDFNMVNLSVWDLNNDNKVNAGDAALLKKIIVGKA